jgi:hypothetical protein
MFAKLCLFLLAAAILFSQTAYYPFSIDQDAISGPLDFSFLNHPLTPADRLFVRDGHFYRLGEDLRPNTSDDTPVRLFGVNLAFGANFPTATDASRIARRLRKLGVNVVRLHHMDSQPDSNPQNAGSLLTTGPYPTLNTIAVERLRTFLDALSAEGIYVNLNLKVGYLFRPGVDGIPAMEPSIPTQSKPLHIFHPRMVELQAEFTRKVFDALKLGDDPVLGMVEINNESSMLWEWQVTNLDSRLNGEYLAELNRQWNGFLRARHESTEVLRRAWAPVRADGPQILGPRWTVEQHSVARANLRIDDSAAGPELNVEFVRGGDTIIIKQVGFSVTQGTVYQADVELRADLPNGVTRSIQFDVKQDVTPWRTMNARTVQVSNQWQKFSMLFTAGFSMEGIGRFGISIENVQANVQIRGAILREAGEFGGSVTETLEAGNVALVKTTERSSRGRSNDFLDFLVETDRAYLNTILAAVRERSGSLTPVAGTQIGFGGLLTIDSHRDLDYHDNHFYIDHYNFPNTAWDGRDWRLRDTSATGSGLSAILNMAVARPAGKPYTVSEYNQNWPNQQGGEIDPLLAFIGAFQDWDGIMHFAYSHGRGWDDNVPNGFNLNGDWTKWVTFGQSAWMFRTGAVAKGTSPLLKSIPLEQRRLATMQRFNGNISGFLGENLSALYQPVSITAEPEQPLPPAIPTSLLRLDQVADEQGTYYEPGPSRVFRMHTPKIAGVIGQTGTQVFDAGVLRLQLADSARGFVVALLTPSDSLPLSESRRLLLSLPGQTLRSQPGTTQPQRLVNYPGTTDWLTLEPEPTFNKPSGNLNGGSRPTYMERIEAFATLNLTAESIRVYPLDGSGQRKSALDSGFITKLSNGFRIHLQADGQEFSPWYEIILE